MVSGGSIPPKEQTNNNIMAYAEKLKDPRWQKKRLEIMKRDEFKCQSCGDDSKTLHVHHVSYFETDRNKPWSTLDNHLTTICEDCHGIWHHIYDNYDPGSIEKVVTLHIKLETEDMQRFLKTHPLSDETF